MTPFHIPAIATTTFLLLCVAPLATMTASTTYIMDEDGEPMLNGGTYYILPQTTANGGGLTVATNIPSPCPLYITQERDGTSNGLLFKISSPISSKYLPFGPTDIYLVGVTSTCSEPLMWRVITDSGSGQYYVAAGTNQSHVPTAFSLVVPFNDGQPWNYQINYCDFSICGSAIIFEESGLLGIKNSVGRVAVRFRKAFTGSPKSTSVI